jgi:hypothetical protein
MNSRIRRSLLVALPITWLLLAAPLSARDDARHADGHYLLYAEQSADQDSSRDFADYQRTRNEEEQQGHVDRERRDSRERNDDASRYYWWWPFRR